MRGTVSRPLYQKALFVLVLFAALVPSSSLIYAGSPLRQIARDTRDYFPIPAAAFVQGLGNIPQNPSSSRVAYQHYQAGRGISLGGIGAGSFMYNQAGVFGPWDFRTPIHEERVLSQAAFHIREQPGGSQASVTTLATTHPLGNVLPAWHTLSPGDGQYAALYPFGWTSYNPFASDISMRFWSPIVAQDDRHSSLPVAYFDMRLANHTASADTLSVMFTFPNAPGCLQKNCTRTGFYSNVQADSQTGVSGVTLGAADPSNVADMQNTEWTIAALPQAGQQVSYSTSWNANGDGSDIYNQFSQSGNLNDGSLDSSHSAAAMAVSTTLQPGQVTTVSFALAWDFPMTLFGNQSGQHSLWMKRYTSYFGTQETSKNNYIPGSYPFHQGFTIADQALSDERNALNLVTNWWNTIANETAYPLWLRQAALNELYYDTTGDSFWESGLVENTYPPSNGGPRVGSQIAGTHLFYNTETTIYNYAESYDVRAYESRQWLLLFPDIERDVQRAWTQFVLEDPNGHAPHDAGRDYTSPYIIWPGDTYGNPSKWLDLPMKYLFQVWEYIHFTGDNKFLRYAYPAMLRSYTYVANVIPAGQYLPFDNGVDNTYDTWHLDGNTSYVGGLWILGEEVMLAATQQALAMGIKGATRQLINTLNTNIPQSRAQFESALWNATQSYYQISTLDKEYGTGVMADAMFAQHVAETLGLPDIVGDPNHLHTHLLTSYNYLVAPWHDAQGRSVGAANGVDANGSIIQTGGNEAQEIWTGVSYFYAATQYLDGLRFADSTLQQNALNTAQGIAQQVYNTAQNGYYFDTPEAWRISDVTQARALQYMRPRAIWELILAIKQPFPWGK